MTGLRIFAHLDGVSDAFLEYLMKKEAVVDVDNIWVDLGTPRDAEFTEEILLCATEYGIADDEGNILAMRPTLIEAESARDRAKVRFELVVDDLDEQPKGAKAAPAPLRTEMSSKSGSVVEAAAGI